MSSQFDETMQDGDVIEALHVRQFADPIQALESGAAYYREDVSSNAGTYKVEFDNSAVNHIEELSDGLMLRFKALTASSALVPATLEVIGFDPLENEAVSLGVFDITKFADQPLEDGDIQAGQMVTVVFNEDGGGRFELPAAGAAAAPPAPAGVPVGSLIAYAGATAPNGWLFCAGQALSRETYAALFAAIGTAYGSGNGTTTFNLPDLRGRMPSGRDDMGGSAAGRITSAGSGVDGVALGAAGGSQSHTLTVNEMPEHTHELGASDGRENPLLDNGSPYMGASYSEESYTSELDRTVASLTSTGGGQAHPILPPTQVVNYLIYAGA